MSGTIHVRASSRLHFGMFSFGNADRPQFGGVGVMVRQPSIETKISRAAHFAASGDHQARVESFVRSITTNWQLANLPPCEIHVSAPPDHIGLGVGTQLGLSVAAGVRRFLDLPPINVAELATVVNRAARSAVGTHGFDHGGLIVDGGKRTNEKIGTLACRMRVPDDWRFVLVRLLTAGAGLAGERESQAFAELPAVPESTASDLWQIVHDEMLPAIKRADYASFGDAVYRFNYLSGECFAPVQGGPFASTETAELIRSIRDNGVPGVGQSSWGPTVFAITDDERSAQTLIASLREKYSEAECNLTITQPDNTGAQLSTSE